MTRVGSSKTIFFPNLNGVRAIAAMMVVIHHVEQTKAMFALPSSYRSSLLGELGVTLFFVLSGFLITYLLLVEKHDLGTISLRAFYARRILRIWPLYYLIIVLAFFIVPTFFPTLLIGMRGLGEQLHKDFGTKLAMYIFFVPNVMLAMPLKYSLVPFASHLWSVGAEEQFYLIWPLLIKSFYRLPAILVSIVGFFLCLHSLLTTVRSASLDDRTRMAIDVVTNYLSMTRIDCMAIGGLAAWLIFTQSPSLNVLYSKPLQLVLYLVTITMIYRDVPISFVGYLPYAILFALIILNLAGNQRTILTLNSTPLDYAGKVSYGLYMYHPLMIVIAIRFVGSHMARYSATANIMFYACSIGLAGVVSVLSYELFEKPCLRLKSRFSPITTGDNAH